MLQILLFFSLRFWHTNWQSLQTSQQPQRRQRRFTRLTSLVLLSWLITNLASNGRSPQLSNAAIAQQPQSCQLPAIPPPRDLPSDPDWTNMDNPEWQKGRRVALDVENLPKIGITNLKDIALTSIAFSPDGQSLAAGTKHVTVRSGNQPQKPATDILGLPQVSQDSRGLVMILSKIYTTQWSANQLYSSKREINSVAFNPKGREQFLVAGGNDKGFVGLWEQSQWKKGIGKPKDQLNKQFSVNVVAFSPDGQILASGGIGGRSGSWNALQRWELKGGKLQPFRAPLQDVREKQPAGMVEDQETFAIAFSPDSKILAAGGMASLLKQEGTVFKPIRSQPFVHLWNARTGKHLCSVDLASSAAISAVAFSPNGTMLAIADTGGDVKVWSLINPGTPQVVVRHQGRVNTMTFSPGGQFLLSGGVDKTIKIWQVKTGQPVKSIDRDSEGKPLFGQQVIAMAFRSDGQALATVAQDANDTIRLFSPPGN